MKSWRTVHRRLTKELYPTETFSNKVCARHIYCLAEKFYSKNLSLLLMSVRGLWKNCDSNALYYIMYLYIYIIYTLFWSFAFVTGVGRGEDFPVSQSQPTTRIRYFLFFVFQNWRWKHRRKSEKIWNTYTSVIFVFRATVLIATKPYYEVTTGQYNMIRCYHYYYNTAGTDSTIKTSFQIKTTLLYRTRLRWV